jgi:DNA-binding NarL/FixJ family response regulator
VRCLGHTRNLLGGPYPREWRYCLRSANVADCDEPLITSACVLRCEGSRTTPLRSFANAKQQNARFPGARTELPHADELRARYALTRREAEVAILLARGASNAEIATRLGIRPSTVRTHAERLFPKVGVHTRKALALVLLETTPSAY